MSEMVECSRCGLPVSPGICAPEPHVFHDRPEACIAALRAKLAQSPLLSVGAPSDRVRIRCMLKRPSHVVWMHDGDVDGDPWEGSRQEAERIIAEKGPLERQLWDYEIVPTKIKL